MQSSAGGHSSDCTGFMIRVASSQVHISLMPWSPLLRWFCQTVPSFVRLSGAVLSSTKPTDWRTVIASYSIVWSTWTWWVLQSDLCTQNLTLLWNENLYWGPLRVINIVSLDLKTNYKWVFLSHEAWQEGPLVSCPKDQYLKQQLRLSWFSRWAFWATLN